jgi:tetratricopeptide (TPR) repeat protein
MDIADCYQILGLRPGADLAEIKASYRNLARQYHPDANGDEQAQERFIKVTQAYKFLLGVVNAPVAKEPDRSPAVSSSSYSEGSRRRSSTTKVTRKEPSVTQYDSNLSERDQRLKRRSYQDLQQLLRHHRFPRAIALMESLAQRLPQDPEVRQWLAVTYQRCGHYLIERKQPDKARIYLKQALKTDPHNRSLWLDVERDFRQIEHLN